MQTRRRSSFPQMDVSQTQPFSERRQLLGIANWASQIASIFLPEARTIEESQLSTVIAASTLAGMSFPMSSIDDGHTGRSPGPLQLQEQVNAAGAVTARGSHVSCTGTLRASSNDDGGSRAILISALTASTRRLGYLCACLRPIAGAQTSSASSSRSDASSIVRVRAVRRMHVAHCGDPARCTSTRSRSQRHPVVLDRACVAE